MKLGIYDPIKYGYVSQSSIGEGYHSFVFIVSDDFLKKNPNPIVSKENSIITKGELSLLKKILQKERYCIDSDNKNSFVVTSKQEKIYDITFEHMIETSYNARPLTPITYFGQCIDSANSN